MLPASSIGGWRVPGSAREAPSSAPGHGTSHRQIAVEGWRMEAVDSRRVLRAFSTARDGRSMRCDDVHRPTRRMRVPKARVVFQPTPNPQAGKFTVDRTLVEGRRGQTFDTAQAAAGHPLAERLLAEAGVESVFIVADFVTVTKRPDADWKELAARVKALLREVL
jgi:hypothetical protein